MKSSHNNLVMQRYHQKEMQRYRASDEAGADGMHQRDRADLCHKQTSGDLCLHQRITRVGECVGLHR